MINFKKKPNVPHQDCYNSTDYFVKLFCIIIENMKIKYMLT